MAPMTSKAAWVDDRPPSAVLSQTWSQGSQCMAPEGSPMTDFFWAT